MNQINLTGIKPTGTPHLGNYLGSIRPALSLAENDKTKAFYFIADYHSLTSVYDGERLRQDIYEVAATWLACGLILKKSLYINSLMYLKFSS